MPFRSEAQRRFLFANHPKIAEEFAAHTPDMASLPERASSSRSTKKSRRGEARLNRSSSIKR